MWLIYVPVLAAILLTVASLGGFAFTFVRCKTVSIAQQSQREDGPLYPFRDRFAEGLDWVRKQQWEQVRQTSHDGIGLHASFLPANSRCCIVMMHGYRSCGENDFSCACRFYHEELGMNLLLVDQRASGRSGGRIITFGAKERHDAVLWAEYVKKRMGEDCDIFLTGVSMGASAVLMAAELDLPAQVRGIIADCGFTTPEEIILKVMREDMHLPKYPLYPLLKLWARLLCGISLTEPDTRRALAATTIPVQLIHGRRDDFVPCRMSEHNYAAATGEKQVFYSETAGHGCSYLCDREALESIIADFVRKHARHG